MKKLPEVSLKLSDGSVYPLKGEIETISGIIDTQTGSSNMRATFANPHKLLRSGGSGVIMIPMKNNQALLVPQKATYEIQDKKFVYVLNDDSTVKSTEITVSSIDNGKDYMVLSGLKVGDRQYPQRRYEDTGSRSSGSRPGTGTSTKQTITLSTSK